MTRGSSRTRQPLSRVNLTGFTMPTSGKNRNIYLSIKTFKNWLWPNFSCCPKNQSCPKFWGGCNRPPAPFRGPLRQWSEARNTHTGTLNSLSYSLLREPGLAQWWEPSPPTSVPGFDSWTRRHIWVEFVVGSLLREVFLRVFRFSPLLKIQHFQIPIRSWNTRAFHLHFFFYIFYCNCRRKFPPACCAHVVYSTGSVEYSTELAFNCTCT